MVDKQSTNPWWKRTVVLAVAVGALAVVAVGGYLMGTGNDDSSDPVASVEDVYERLAIAIQTSRFTQFDEVTHAGRRDLVQPALMGWQIAHLGLDPTFSECVGVSTVTCDLAYGAEYFYSRVLGHNVNGSVTVRVFDDGTFIITQWPFPDEIIEVETDLREWIELSHAEVGDRMFGNDAYGVFKFTEDALLLHAQYLDGYMTYRGA